MNKGNLSITILLVPLFLISIYSIILANEKAAYSELTTYKKSFFNNCNKVDEQAPKALIFKEVNKNEIVNGDNEIIKDYESSQCVNLQAKQYKSNIKVEAIKINHIQGRNDQSYQSSYQYIYQELNKVKNKNRMQQQLLNALDYIINNKEASMLLPSSEEKYELNHAIIGPDKNAPTGTYVLNLDMNLIKNTIYKKENDQLIPNKTIYTFDSLIQNYVKEGA